MKLHGKDIYLDTLEREHCRTIWANTEFDLSAPYESLNVGLSVENADTWFDETQQKQGKTDLRLGIFLEGEPIGDVALQGIDWTNRSCSVGMGFAKLEHRQRGYGRQALALILEHGFCRMGLERITADTLQGNLPAQKSLEGAGFCLEGCQRMAVYLNGQKLDRLNYAMLKHEYDQRESR